MNEQNNNQRKATAILFIFFLLFMYKEMIWDPFFHPHASNLNQNGQIQNGQGENGHGTVAPVATPAVTNTPTWQQPVGTPSPANAKVNGEAIAAFHQDQNQFPNDQQLAEAGTIRVETDKAVAVVTKLGGRLLHLTLKDYRQSIDRSSPQLDLVDHVETAPLPFGVYSGAVNDGWVNYSATVSTVGVSGDNYVISGEKDLTVELTGVLPDQRAVKKTIHFTGSSYVVGMDVALSGAPADKSRLEVEWTKLVAANGAAMPDPYNAPGYTWYDGSKANRTLFTKLETSPLDLGDVSWVSQGDKYFVEALVSQGAAAPARAIKLGQLYGSRISGGDSAGSFLLYLGPKSYQTLVDVGHDLKLNIDFGKTGFIAAPLLALLHLFYSILHNYGLAIIALTLMVKAVLYPLNASSFRQMKAMSDLTPEVERIRNTIKDKQAQQLEMMNLYKKRGVNPFGGCLPIVMQMPIFFGLYSALMLSIELRHAPFALWIGDLAGPERLMIGGVAIPVMVILFTASMLVQQWMTPSNLDPTQKKVMLVMPVVFGFMFMGFPAGLTLYWLTNNIISIGQQKAMRSGSPAKAVKITAMVSVGLFGFAWILTKLWPVVH